MTLRESLMEEGFIKESEEGELELTSSAEILLINEYAGCFDIETAIMSLCEREMSDELSAEETKEAVEIMMPLVDEGMI